MLLITDVIVEKLGQQLPFNQDLSGEVARQVAFCLWAALTVSKVK